MPPAVPLIDFAGEINGAQVQLKQVVHASADEVDVRVVESGDHAMPERVDHRRTRPDQSSNVALIAHGG